MREREEADAICVCRRGGTLVRGCEAGTQDARTQGVPLQGEPRDSSGAMSKAEAFVVVGEALQDCSLSRSAELEACERCAECDEGGYRAWIPVLSLLGYPW